MIEHLSDAMYLPEQVRQNPENLRLLPMRTAIVGLGGISTPYVDYLHRSPEVSVISGSDYTPERTRARAHDLSIPHPATFEEILNDPTIEMIVNLTPPSEHARVAREALTAGKHVFTEKPLAKTFEEGKELVELAEEQSLYYACAPDTFLGPHFRTAQEVIEEGLIGDILHISGTLKTMGPRDHVNPEPFFTEGGGPVFDWGPYYLTHAVNLLGPIESLTADGRFFTEEMLIDNPQSTRYGEIFPVTIPTNVNTILRFGSGIRADFMLSFEVNGTQKQSLDIHGTKGTLRMVSPNQYNGTLLYGHDDSEQFEEIPQRYEEVGPDVRGYGVTRFARAIRTGEPCPLDARLGLHILEAMEAIHTATKTDTRQYLTTSPTI